MDSRAIKFGVVGSRGNDTSKLLESLFVDVKALIRKIVYRIAGGSSFTLVSGGSSFVDAVAPYLFRRGEARWLILHFPCKWDKGRFSEESREGKILNYNHRLTSDIFFQDSNYTLEDIQYAIDADALTTVTNGFFNRNSLIARDSDYLICCTFGNKDKLAEGGTMDTFKKFIMIKDHRKTFHIDLNTLEVYSPASF